MFFKYWLSIVFIKNGFLLAIPDNPVPVCVLSLAIKTPLPAEALILLALWWSCFLLVRIVGGMSVADDLIRPLAAEALILLAL